MAVLVLADGTVYEGDAFGHEAETSGEVVFHTGMTGYQEILTDPSYFGQIVVMTYPHIGNYGIINEDDESRRPWVNGFVVYECSEVASNPRTDTTLNEYLKEHEIPGIENIDTRALTRRIRDQGAMPGLIHPGDPDEDRLEELKNRAAELPTMEGQNLVLDVTRDEPEDWNSRFDESIDRRFDTGEEMEASVVAMDYGIKNNILRNLKERFSDVTVVPADHDADQILAQNPDGVFLSNGPGDPAALPELVETLRNVIERDVPVYGICLGHQLLARAMGAETYKLKFGHHGANHPVKDLETDQIEITSQNHGFAVDRDSAEDAGFDITHINLNDDTVEGMKHTEKPVECVQFHPEAAPGPHDSCHLFSRFRNLIQNHSSPTPSSPAEQPEEEKEPV